MQIPENIAVLIEKYQSGTATPEEKSLLDNWYHSFDAGDEEQFVDAEFAEQEVAGRIKNRLLETVRGDRKVRPASLRSNWKRPAIAAAILVLVGTAALTWFNFFRSKQDKSTAGFIKPQKIQDLAPGTNKAVLILADGSAIILDSATNGTISQQGNIRIQKLDNGLLAYTVNEKAITEKDEAFYNTISTPRGGQYHVTLTDGTEVWLNAASSIRFPVVFTGKERRVVITGEAYFEVAKNANMPFRVKTATSEVEVLGTHFNVNAYDDEATVRTSLLEGRVKVTAGNSPANFLEPGQQSSISKEGKISVYSNVDMEEVMAWKNGRFQYNSADLQSILRQISRWYDADIEYRGKVNLHFTGQLPRSSNASQVFEKLEMTGEVHFKVDGKKIIVTE